MTDHILTKAEMIRVAELFVAVNRFDLAVHLLEKLVTRHDWMEAATTYAKP